MDGIQVGHAEFTKEQSRCSNFHEAESEWLPATVLAPSTQP
jgi:hypothetical protein